MIDTSKYFFLNYVTLQEILLHYDKLSKRKVKYVITRANHVKVDGSVPVQLLKVYLQVDDFLNDIEIQDIIKYLQEAGM